MKSICRLLSLLLIACCLLGTAMAEQSTAFTPIPWDDPASPYKANPANFLPDNTGYHDDSLDIRVVHLNRDGCKILLVYVEIADPSQLRTASASRNPMSQETAPVPVMAARNNAVLAINGDFYNYHNEGIVYRNGKQYRMRPAKIRDTLIIDDKGDFTIISPSTRQAFNEFTGNVIQAFCFGPGLVVNGEQLMSTDHINGFDIMKEKRDQRLAIGQLGPLSYVIITVDGPNYAESEGMTILEFAALCKEVGCINAYNLDGGNSAYVLLGENKLNALDYGKSRTVCDILFFATLVPNN